MEKAEFKTTSEEETRAAGRAFARILQKGDVVILSGELGAGKTVFVRGVAEGAGGRADMVTSPTFALVNVYETTAYTIYHVDAYRLTGPDDFVEIGGDDILESGGVVLIEWGEKIAAALDGAGFVVTFEPDGISTRRIAISGDNRLEVFRAGFKPGTDN